MADANFPSYSERPDLYRIAITHSTKWNEIFPSTMKNALNIIFIIEPISISTDKGRIEDKNFSQVTVIRAQQGYRWIVMASFSLPADDPDVMKKSFEGAVRINTCRDLRSLFS